MDFAALDRKLARAWGEPVPPAKRPAPRPAKRPALQSQRPLDAERWKDIQERRKNLFANRDLLGSLPEELRWRALGYVLLGED